MLSYHALHTNDTPCICSISILVVSSIIRRLPDTNSRIPWDRAIYSASKSLNDISYCSFELQYIRTSPKVRSIHVLLFTLMGSSLSSAAKNPANYTSANKCKRNFILFGFMISPLLFAPLRYLLICFRATSCDLLGLWEKQAHWWTAYDISGRVLPPRYNNIPTMDL